MLPSLELKNLPKSCSHVKGTTRMTRCSVVLPSLFIVLELLLTLLALAGRCCCWHGEDVDRWRGGRERDEGRTTRRELLRAALTQDLTHSRPPRTSVAIGRSVRVCLPVCVCRGVAFSNNAILLLASFLPFLLPPFDGDTQLTHTTHHTPYLHSTFAHGGQ